MRGYVPLGIGVVGEEKSSVKIVLTDSPTFSAAVVTVAVGSIFVTSGGKIDCVHGQTKLL